MFLLPTYRIPIKSVLFHIGLSQRAHQPEMRQHVYLQLAFFFVVLWSVYKENKAFLNWINVGFFAFCPKLSTCRVSLHLLVT